MSYEKDERIVLTLDAGGTNFVFSAIRGNEEIVGPVRLPSEADQLDRSLNNLVKGFEQVRSNLDEEPVAISFAFPGPADYERGIIGDLGNLPGYRGGVALGPMLQEQFNLPVFINNDGDLFAYGEALSGSLPYVNQLLEDAGSPKRFKNLLGITLGTGLGGGIVSDGRLYKGDNSAAGEMWLLRNKLDSNWNAEEGACIRAVQRTYGQLTNLKPEEIPTPKDIYEIAEGKQEGNRDAALKAYDRMAEVLGDALANALTLLDGMVVIGGGLAGAQHLFLQKVVDELNGTLKSPGGEFINRLVSKVYNLENKEQQAAFCKGDVREIKVPKSDKTLQYDPVKRIGVSISKLGTSEAIAIGAYSVALQALDAQ